MLDYRGRALMLMIVVPIKLFGQTIKELEVDLQEIYQKIYIRNNVK